MQVKMKFFDDDDKVTKKKVEFILSTTAKSATDKVNKWIEEIESDPTADLIAIKPLICFSGPSMQIGAMLEYYVSEEVGNETSAK